MYSDRRCRMAPAAQYRATRLKTSVSNVQSASSHEAPARAIAGMGPS